MPRLRLYILRQPVGGHGGVHHPQWQSARGTAGEGTGEGEETGLEARSMSYLFSLPNLYEYSGMIIHTIDMFFRVEVDANAVPHADDDAASLQWVPLSDVQPALFGLNSIRRAVELFQERKLK